MTQSAKPNVTPHSPSWLIPAVVAAVLILIAALILVWRPWSSRDASTSTHAGPAPAPTAAQTTTTTNDPTPCSPLSMPSLCQPETTILQADNTFHRSSAQRGDEAGGMTTFDASPRTPRASIAPARSRVSPQAGSVAASTVALMTVGSAPVAQQHLVASRHLGRLPNWTTSRWRIWEISAGEHYGQSAVSGVWLSAPGLAPAPVSRRVPALPG